MAVLGRRTQTTPRQLTTWERVKGAGAKTLGAIGDVLSRGNYAVANVANEAVKSKQGKNFNANPLSAFYEGLSGRKKTTFEDVLTTAGVGDMRVKLPFNKSISGKKALGFVGDVVLDPTTYLTLGTGAGAKIAVKQGGKAVTKTLTKKATREMAEMAAKRAAVMSRKKAAGKVTSKLADMTGERYAAREMAKKIASDPGLAKSYIDKGGIKFAGATIPGTDKIVQPVSDAVRGFTGKFGRDATLKGNQPAKRIFQQARDIEQATLTASKQNIYETFRGVNKAERRMITEYLDGTLKSLPPKLQDKAAYAKNLLDELAKDEGQRGILKNIVETYVPHLYENAEQVQKVVKNFNPGSRFAKERSFKNLNEAIETAGLKPIYDIEKLLNARVASSTKATIRHDLQKALGEEFGLPSKVFKTTKETVTQPYRGETSFGDFIDSKMAGIEDPNTGTVTITKRKVTAKANPELLTGSFTPVPGSSALKGVQIPTDIYNYMKTMDEKMFSTPGTQMLLKGYDKALQFVKASLTSIFPSFHVRNAASNVLQNYVDVGLMQAINPRLHYNALALMKPNVKDQIITVAGKQWRAEELRKIMRENGILTGRGIAEYEGVMPKGIAEWTTQLGRRGGTAIENEARAVNFLANMERSGGLIAEAAERTKKFLFDYDNLGPTEKDIMKRVFPFYTWTSKNVALTAEQLIKNPGKYANQFKAVNAVSQEITPEEYELLPDWQKNKFTLKTGNDGKNMYYSTGLGTPIEAFAETVGQPGKTAMNMLTPFAKYPMERATGYDTFRERPISEVDDAKGLSWLPQSVKDMIDYDERTEYNKYKGKDITKKTADPDILHLLRQPPVSRLFSAAQQLDPTAKGTDTQKYLRALTGFNQTDMDIKDAEYWKNKEANDKLAEPLVRKGILKKGYGGYYLNKKADISPEQRAEANAIISSANSGQTSSGKLSKKEMKIAAIVSSMEGLSDEEKAHAIKAIEYIARGYKTVPKSGYKGRSASSYYKKAPGVSVPKVSTGVKQLKTIKAKKAKRIYAKNR